MQLPPLYRLWDEGERIEGIPGRPIYLVGIEAYAKPVDDTCPYEYACELICGELAKAIRLPVAHGVFVERKGMPCYASFNSYMSEGQPPPCIEPVAVQLVARHGRVACGIVVFDLWVSNKDRHKRNVAFDVTKDTVHIFDHGAALISGSDPTGHWKRNENTIDLQNHVIAKVIDDNSLSYADEWIDRIAEIPETFIRKLFDEAKQFGLTSAEAKAGSKFLVDRRKTLRSLIDSSPHSFPKAINLFKGGG